MTVKTEDVFQARGPIRLAETEGCTIWQFRNETGAAPFYCMYRLISLFVAGTVTKAAIGNWCLASLAAYVGKILFFSLSTGISHSMAYTILESLRLRLADRFLHAPLGDVEGHTIGEIKNMMVDKIESIEPPLAYMIPDGAGHIVLPIVSIAAEGIYL